MCICVYDWCNSWHVLRGAAHGSAIVLANYGQKTLRQYDWCVCVCVYVGVGVGVGKLVVQGGCDILVWIKCSVNEYVSHKKYEWKCQLEWCSIILALPLSLNNNLEQGKAQTHEHAIDTKAYLKLPIKLW